MRTDHARRAEILAALARCCGDAAKAAEELGVTRQWVYRVAQQHAGSAPKKQRPVRTDSQKSD